MPLFCVIATDAPGTLQQRLDLRPQHLERLNALNAQGKLVLAGPCPVNPANPAEGVLGSLLVLDFEDRAALDAWLSEEPFVLHGVYASVEVRPFLKALP